MKSRNAGFLDSLSSYSQMFFEFLRTPTEVALPVVVKKRRRLRSSFESNKTASIALSTEPPLSAPVKAAALTPYPLVNTVVNFFSAYLPASLQPTIEKKVRRAISTEPVHAHMAMLETEFKKHKAAQDRAKMDAVLLKKVEFVAEEIKEHAARRVDLFFYLLVAVHGRKVVVTKDSTRKQNGSGSMEYGTQACHSSLFPQVKLKWLPSQWLWNFYQPPCPSFSGTQFEESLNMTVELPGIVNDFDGRLEGRYQQTRYMVGFIEILNRAAKNELDIRSAMNEFLQMMNLFFVETEKKLKANRKNECNQTLLKVWEYEKAGTFLAAKDDFTVKDEYIQMMLRLPPTNWLTNRAINYGCVTLQNEIFGNKHKTRHRSASVPA